MKRVLGILLFIFTTCACIGLSPSRAQAATTGMKIHGIYLPGSENTGAEETKGGDAVLIESNGDYLLMDCGSADASSSLISYLRNVGATKIDVYISHLHVDHYGGLQALLDSTAITVGTVYVPYVSIDPYYSYNGYGYSDLMKAAITDPARAAGCEVVGLFNSPGDMLNPESCSQNGNLTYEDLVDQFSTIFTVGNVVARVLGPSAGSLSMADFSADSCGSKAEHYLNNRSLVVSLSDGSKTFLTAGDAENVEEEQLLSRYGNAAGGKLDADIFKLSRHGLATSNSVAFLKAVTPNWSFASNQSQTGSNGETDPVGAPVCKTYASWLQASTYGFTCLVGNEKRTLVMDTNANGVSLTLGSKVLTGMVKVYTPYNAPLNWTAYYLDNHGYGKQGIQQINGQTYYFGVGGRLEMGYLSDEAHRTPDSTLVYGANYYYNPVITTNGQKRYYPDMNTGACATGFQTLNDGLYYFQNADGLCLTGDCEDAEYAVVTVDGTAYAVKGTGQFRRQAGTVKIKNSNYAYAGSTNHNALLNGWQGGYYYGLASYVRCGSPIELTSVTAKSTGLTLKWTQAIQGSGYYLYRATSYKGSYTKLKTITKVDTLSYEDTTAVKGKAYFYKVLPYYTVTIGSDSTKKSGEYSASKGSFLRGISGFAASAGTGKVTLSWKKASYASGYAIYRSTKSGSGYKKVKTISGNTTLKTTLTGQTSKKKYYYKMRPYKVVDGKTLYGYYCTPLAVTIK